MLSYVLTLHLFYIFVHLHWASRSDSHVKDIKSEPPANKHYFRYQAALQSIVAIHNNYLFYYFYQCFLVLV